MIFRLLENQEKFFPAKFQSVIFCIPESTTSLQMDTISRLRKICPDNLTIYEGIPIVENLNVSSPILLILDDVYHKAVKSPYVYNLMTFGCRRLGNLLWTRKSHQKDSSLTNTNIFLSFRLVCFSGHSKRISIRKL